MKLLVFADSHGRTLEMHQAIALHLPDAILHLGDCYRDTVELRHAYPKIPLYAVRGNNDWDAGVPDSCVVVLEDVRIYMTHGHLARCHGDHVESLPFLAEREQCTLALYGHTHRIHQEVKVGVTCLNPGSICRPRGGAAGYALITLAQGEIEDITIYNPTTD